MREKQAQKAGANSQLIQVRGDLVQGVTLEQALEVADLTARKVVAEEFQKADKIGLDRIQRLNNEVVRRLSELDKLASFADPSFRVLLRKAQIGAASTERDADYDMLAQLLSDRATRGEQRKVRAGIDRAVQIVDQLDDASLVGLTVLQATMQFSPARGMIAEGLDILDSLYGQLLLMELPSGSEWLDHLDILDAIRISQVSTLARFADFYPNHMTGYLAHGVEADSDSERSALEKLKAVQLNISHEEHELKPGYRRLPFASLEQLENALRGPVARSAEQIEVGLQVAQEDYGLGQADPSLKPALMDLVDARPNLAVLHHWWDEIPNGIQVTAVGRVLARANAKRCDSLGLLPDLD